MAKPKLPAKSYIWTPKFAYAVGLLVTDGNLSKDGRHITLRSCDVEQLNNFRKCLDNKNLTIKRVPTSHFGGRPCFRIQFSGVQLYRWLLTIGLFPLKTYTIGPILIPEKFFRDFLRGHLDGDGTITVFEDTYNIRKNPAYRYQRLFVRFISASRAHLEWLRATITKLTRLKGDFCEIKSKIKNHVSIWQLKFMKKESMKLIPWLYYSPNLPCLTRKRKKAKHALKLVALTKRKKYTRKIQ